ncbi:MAG: ABC transporter ATP-binding protein [Actinomycetota bacterium]|nr:ABC transporter ATP-binding protein [Actinomycetota bacterium]
MMNSVEVRELEVVRGDRQVLPSIDLAVAPGELVGLIGPSGSGKSTLMRAIVGVQVVRSGSVTVLGVDAGSAEARARVGYVTQAPSVYGDLTVRENLRFFAAVVGAPEDRVAEIVSTVRLDDHIDDLVGRLSGGQQSRASLAAALLGEPELLVLDEPTVGLDPVVRDELWALFRRLCEEGVTLLVSSHVMDEADRCDRVLLLRDGVVLADGSPAALRARTGADDLEGAFLRLVGEEVSA